MDKIGLTLSILAWGLIHSITASNRVKDLVQRRLGQWINPFYRILYNVFAVLTFSPILIIYYLMKDETLYVIHPPWIYLNLLIQLVSFILLMVGLKQTGTAEFLGLSGMLGRSVSSKMIKDGLYAYVRHPLYSTGLVLLWLIPVMTINRLIFCSALTIYLVIGAFFEERKLINQFGDDYREYLKKVPMLLPLKGRNKID